MPSKTSWQRVSRRRPCPVCGKADWCMYTGDPQQPDAAICQRVESPKRCGEGGWLHHLRDDGPTWSPRVRRIEMSAARITAEPIDFDRLAADFRAAVQSEALGRLAVNLGLTVESLTRLGVGWAAQHRAWAFPMCDRTGRVRGIRLRLPTGRKLAVRGGREGLFIPEALDASGRLLIAEGPTDTAALLDLGFQAVGRPSCTGGLRLLVEAMLRWKPAEVVIVADADAPGEHGAESLGRQLMPYCAVIRIIAPPAGIKDARAWKQAGATAADVLAVIDAAPVRQLTIAVMGRAAR